MSDSAVTARSSDKVIAYTILRLSFGANIFLHGVSRLLGKFSICGGSASCVVMAIQGDSLASRQALGCGGTAESGCCFCYS